MTPRVLLVGGGGYGNIYLEELLRGVDEGRVQLAAVVETAPQGCKYLAELERLGVPVVPEMDNVLTGKVDLAIVSTPIHFHEEHTCRALAAGVNVLCEKPLAATVEQAMRIRAAEKASDRFVAVGYQWSFAEPVMRLKRDILAGELGAALRFKALICWPRPESYFRRNVWAGQIALPNGAQVMDSPAHNAMAHYLHNMLSLAPGLREVSAEVYRTNRIENYDTVALRAITSSGAEILFYASHAVETEQGPILEYEFSKAVVRLHGQQGNRLVATFHEGGVRDYGEILEYPHRDYFRKVWMSLDATQGGPEVPCTAESAIPQVICVNAIQRPSGEIPNLEITKGAVQAALNDCFERSLLPAETGAYPWSTKS